MKEFEKGLHIENQIFDETRTELNQCIQDIHKYAQKRKRSYG